MGRDTSYKVGRLEGWKGGPASFFELQATS